jgi:hypothetical protein
VGDGAQAAENPTNLRSISTPLPTARERAPRYCPLYKIGSNLFRHSFSLAHTRYNHSELDRINPGPSDSFTDSVRVRTYASSNTMQGRFHLWPLVNSDPGFGRVIRGSGNGSRVLVDNIDISTGMRFINAGAQFLQTLPIDYY